MMIDLYLSQIFGLDIVTLYTQNPLLFDFAIYSILFVGICHVTLSKIYKGRMGRVISLVIGVMLALGMVVLEEQRDFRIGSFGFYAFLLLILVLAIMAYNFMAFTQGSNIQRKPNPFNLSRLSPLLKREDDIRSESKLVKDGLRTFIGKEKRLGRDILWDLRKIRKDFERYALDPTVKRELSTLFHRLQDRQKSLQENLNRFYRFSQIVQNQDIEGFREETIVYKMIPRQMQLAVLKNLQSERFRINLENKSKILLEKMSLWNTRAHNLVNDSLQAIRMNDIEHAKQFISDAIKIEQYSNAIVRDLSSLDKWLYRNLIRSLNLVKKMELNSSG